MAADKSVSVHVGPDFAALLGVAFIVLKLTGVIAWSWLWVLAPIWIPLLVVLLGFIVIMTVLVVKR